MNPVIATILFGVIWGLLWGLIGGFTKAKGFLTPVGGDPLANLVREALSAVPGYVLAYLLVGELASTFLALLLAIPLTVVLENAVRRKLTNKQ